MLGFGWHLADEQVKIALTGADGPTGDDLGTVLLSTGGHGHGLLMDI
jgi:hypothetical protein